MEPRIYIGSYATKRLRFVVGVTLPETKKKAENKPLEKDISIGKPIIFGGEHVSFRECTVWDSLVSV